MSHNRCPLLSSTTSPIPPPHPLPLSSLPWQSKFLRSDFGANHTALQMGPLVLHWYDNGFPSINVLYSASEEEYVPIYPREGDCTIGATQFKSVREFAEAENIIPGIYQEYLFSIILRSVKQSHSGRASLSTASSMAAKRTTAVTAKTSRWQFWTQHCSLQRGGPTALFVRLVAHFLFLFPFVLTDL